MSIPVDDVRTLWELVQHYSPSGQESAAVDYLVQRFRTLGYTRAFRDEAGNAVGVMGEGPRQIVLLGHIDTVPGEIPVRVETHPDEGAVLYGRGTVDAKGPLAAFTDAVAALGTVPGWQLVVIGAVDEERESHGARHVVGRYRPAFAIIGEPSRWDRVTLGYKGSAWAEITVRRTLAHTAGQAESACEAAVQRWNAVLGWCETFNAERPRAFDRVLPTLRAMSSGGDGFEEWASLRVGVRLPPDLLPEDWYERLRSLVADATVTPVGYPIPAYRADRRTPLVRAFLGAIRAAGGRPGFVVKTGTADLNIVAPVWGCPALAYGPGDSSLDHTPDEHIVLEEYRCAVEVLTGVLRHLAVDGGW